MKIHVKGIIIREINWRENDKIVKIFTAEKGIISAVVRGAKKIQKKAFAELLSYCQFSLIESRDLYILDEVEIIELFWGVRSDISKLSLAQYFCELCVAWKPDESNSGDLLRLILNTFYFIANGKKDINILKAIFELRGCSMCGYMPNLTGCFRCHNYNPDSTIFLIKQGIIVCKHCILNAEIPESTHLAPGLLYALRHIIYSPFDKLFSFRISENLQSLLFDICEKYIHMHIGTNFKSLQIYKSML